MSGRVGRERIVALAWGAVLTAIMAVLIIVGSRNLQHFDAALVVYTFAVIFATWGVVYHSAVWIQKPPTQAPGQPGRTPVRTAGITCSRRILAPSVAPVVKSL